MRNSHCNQPQVGVVICEWKQARDDEDDNPDNDDEDIDFEL